MLVFMFFGGLWIINFIIYAAKMIVIVSVCTYYFNSNDEQEGAVEVCYGFKLAYLTHAGSIAMGTFLFPFIGIAKYTVY